MSWSSLVLFELILFICVVQGDQNNTNNVNSILARQKRWLYDTSKVEVTVFYASMCPGSIQFFSKDLNPTMEKLGSYINLNLVPYGFAHYEENRNGWRELKCQHGEMECFGNRIHACAIDILDKYSAFRYINCLMEHVGIRITSYPFDFKLASLLCGLELGFIPYMSRVYIFICAYSDEGSSLISIHERATLYANPKSIPYILVNNEKLETHLPWKICSLLQPSPIECNAYFRQQQKFEKHQNN